MGSGRNRPALEAFWTRVRKLESNEIGALAVQSDLSGRVPAAFDQIATLAYANEAYLVSMRVFHEETPTAKTVDSVSAMRAGLAVASAGAAVAARHRLSSANRAILEAAWRDAGIDDSVLDD